MTKRSLFLALCAAAALAGCKESGSRTAKAEKPLVGGVGQQLLAGRLSDLRVSPDYRFATVLKDAQKPALNGISPKLRVGELEAVSLTDGTVRKLGEGVTNSPGGYLFSPDARWVVLLEGYNAASQAGQAKAVDLSHPEAAPAVIGQAVTFFTFSPDSKWLAWVDGGVLKLGRVGEAGRALSGEVSTADFTADAKALVYRRKLSAGAALFVARVGDAGEPTQIAEGVVDYHLSPDSTRLAFTQRDAAHPDTVDLFVSALTRPAPKKVAEGTDAFAFSPDGKWLARTEGFRPSERGALRVGPASGGAGKKVGDKVQAFQFAPDSGAVAALTAWNDRSRTGKLAVATLPEVSVTTLPQRARDLAWDPTGHFLAFSAQVLKPMISVDLFVYTLGQKDARKVGAWVYGWAFAPKGDRLLFRTECQRQGRACELDALELTKETPAKKLLSAVYTFQASPDAKRLLFTYARMDSDTFDVATYAMDSKQRLTLDERALLPMLFAAEDGSRAVYVIQGGERPGLYLAKTAGGVVQR